MSHPHCINRAAHLPAALIETWFDRACAATGHAAGCAISNKQILIGYDEERDRFRIELRNPLHRVLSRAYAHLFADDDAARGAAEVSPPKMHAELDLRDCDDAILIDDPGIGLVPRQRVVVTDGSEQIAARVRYSYDEDLPTNQLVAEPIETAA